MLFLPLIIFQLFQTAARSTIYLILHLYMTHRWFRCIHIPLSIRAIMYFYLTSRLIWNLKKKTFRPSIICRLLSILADWIRRDYFLPLVVYHKNFPSASLFSDFFVLIRDAEHRSDRGLRPVPTGAVRTRFRSPWKTAQRSELPEY